MEIIVRKIIYIVIFFILAGLFFVHKVNAASLVSVSDTLTTSRPSAAAPLNTDQAAAVSQAQIFDNGSIFLASDSAVIYPDTGELLNSGLNVASMSATAIPSATNRIVYFTGTVSNAHHKGNTLITNITATHQIKFTTVTTIPSSGKIIITFPGAGANTASPSATGFSFNGMTTTNPADVLCFPTAACNSGSSIAVTGSNTITFTTSGSIAGGTVVYANIGCTTQSSGICTVFAPRLINPTKTAAAGTSDSWKVTIQTQDNNLVNLDYGALRAATIESVQVQALVEPTITFTIAGLANSANYNSSAGQCGSETSNSVIDSTATFVNLGILNTGGPNKAGQTLTVSTNGTTGYAITATSSGRFINSQVGFWLPDGNGGNGLTANDTPVPAVIPANGTAFFGISPCGADVPTAIWGATGTTMVASSATVSNPWNTGTNGFYATLASNTSGPVSNALTVIRYGAEISGNTPAGVYTTTLTYIATATF